MEEEQQEPFLIVKDHDENTFTTQASVDCFRISWKWKMFGVNFMIHFLLLAIYTVCIIVAVHVLRESYSQISAFEDLAFTYSKTVFHNLSQTPYAGPPSPELDAAWETLLAPMHMRVSREELRNDNQESVALPEGGGYLSWMGVFHELHCIKMLREWHYRSHYHAEISPEEKKHIGSHIDHCFEMLRQSAVCHADTSLTTFQWHPQKLRPMFNASESIHVCVDWNVLMDSAARRVVGKDEISRLRNPLMDPQ